MSQLRSLTFNTVATPPVITVQPQSAVVAIGGPASLSVTNTGTAPFAYQWLKDGALLAGETNRTLSLASFQFTNSGCYSVVITNATGMAISFPASLTVSNAPLKTWGYNAYGQLGIGNNADTNRPVTAASNIVAAAASVYCSFFLQADGTLWATGTNGYGQLGTGSTPIATNRPVLVTSNVVAVAATEKHSLFVRTDGTLWGMGTNDYGEFGIGSTPTATNRPMLLTTNVVAVAAGFQHTLFVRADGTLWAMGYNSSGQLGNGNNTSTNRPISVASNVVAVAAGLFHSLFLKADGTLWAMGQNTFGQLGNGTTSQTNLPVCVASNGQAVAAGLFHSLFAKADGTLWTMGRNDYGQLGNGTSGTGVYSSLPVNVASNVAAVGAGQYHSLFVRGDGTLWTMGYNFHGELGNGRSGSTTSTNLPVQVSGLTAASLGSAGMATHSLAVSAASPQAAGLTNQTKIVGQPFAFSVTVTNGDGPFTYQWQHSGTNLAGATSATYSNASVQVSDAGTYSVAVTGPFGNAASFSASLTVLAAPVITAQPQSAVVAIGGPASLSVTNTGEVPFGYLWMKDGVLLLGQTNSSVSFASFQFTNSGSYRVVVTNAAGMAISLPASLSVSNAPLLGWGYNNYGQLGNGTTTPTNRPISLASNVVAAAAGHDYSLFVRSDGALWAMGYNGSGQFGNGTTTPTNRPISVASNVVAAAAGYMHSLFVQNDGTLWAMGDNIYGQLGNGTTRSTNRPISVASNVVAVAAGSYHSLFVKSDGTLWAMGYNGKGQVGNGTTVNANLPVSVASNVVAVAGAEFYSLFVKRGGTLWAMGYNAKGQLGNGTLTDTNRPISVASNVVAAAAGALHSLFVTSDGTLWTMGWNGSGQLGNGTLTDTNRPISVASNVVAAGGGTSHSLFEKSDGTLWAMGNNGNGQLGNGNNANQSSPVLVANVAVASLAAMGQADHSLAVAALAAEAAGLTNQTTIVGQPFAFSVTVTNGNGPFTYQWQHSGTNLPGATSATYSEASAKTSDAGTYAVAVTGPFGNAASFSAVLAVNKGTPNVMTWPTASAITYDQTLASSTLVGGTATPVGNFDWTTPTTVPNAGTAAQSVTYTPTDTANYNPTNWTVSVTVNKATPSVTTWPTASAIEHGQALSNSVLTGGSASVAGGFAWTSPSTMPAAGTSSQSVTFTPTDTANYLTTNSTVSVTVNNHAPVGTDNTIAMQTGATNTFSVADWGFSDPLDAPPNNFTRVKLTTLPAAGQLQVEGTNASAGQFVSVQPGPPGEAWTARETNRSYDCVASSADGTRLVVATYGGQLYTSTDGGTNWTVRQNSRLWRRVASSADGLTLLAATDSGPLYISKNGGTNWTTRESSRMWNGVASSADGSKLVAVVNPGQVYTSTDGGTNWAAQGSSHGWHWVASSADGSKLVGAEYGGKIYTSTDGGTNWTARENVRGWYCVASSADGNRLVAAPQNGQLYVSTDGGTNWTARESSRMWDSVASSADGSKLVAGPRNSPLYVSTDGGISWTARGSSRGWNIVASSADGNKLVVGGPSYLGTSVPLPPPAITYTAAAGASTNTFTFQVEDDGVGNNLDPSPKTITLSVAKRQPVVTAWPTASAITQGQALLASTLTGGSASVAGGFAWKLPATVPPVGTNTESVVFSPTDAANYFSVTGSVSVVVNAFVPVPGVDWTIRASAVDNAWRSVAYGNGVFVAVANGGDGNRVMTSSDGINWTMRTPPTNNSWTSVTYGKGVFVAVSGTGNGDRVMTSPDGITWTVRASAADNGWTTVTYGNGLFVAVSVDGTGNRVMTSPDGITWTSRASATDNQWFGVTYGNGLFVAVGFDGVGDRVMTSPDGITWTSRTAAADNRWFGVTYGNGLFVAVAFSGVGNRVMTSPDGITWTIRTSAADNSWSGVTYGSGLFVAVASSGTGNRVMTSPDGTNWTARNSAADNQWLFVTYANGMFVAVANSGTGNRVMTSGTFVPPDPSTTTLASSLNPSTFGDSVTFRATVTPTNATGTMTFKDGATTLGTGTLSGGVATYTTSALTADSHSLTAEYAGDANYLASTSSVLSQAVNPAGPITRTPVQSGPWNDPATWGGTLPAAGDDVVIPVGITVTVGADPLLVRNLTIAGTLTVSGTQTIQISGNYTNSGTFNPGTGTVELTGGADQTLVATAPGTLTFYKLTVNKVPATATVTATSKVKATKKLTLTSGKLVSGSDYGDILIETDGTLELTSDITIGGDLVIQGAGTLTTAGFKLTFDGGIEQHLTLDNLVQFDDLTVSAGTTLIETESADNVLVNGTLLNQGVIRKTQAVSDVTWEGYYFGLAGRYHGEDMLVFVLDLTGSDPLTALQVDRIDANHPQALGTNSTALYWRITPTGSDYLVNLALPHAGLPTPTIGRYDGSGWDFKRTPPNIFTPPNLVTRENITAFSDWAVYNSAAPVANDATYQRELAVALRIRIADLAWDADGQPITVVALGAGDYGATITHNNTYILYQPGEDFSDAFTYSVSNGSSTNTGTIFVEVARKSSGFAQTITLINGEVTIKFFGLPGQQYDVERTTDLNDPLSWRRQTDTPLAPGADGSFEFTDAQPPLPGPAYYRSVQYAPGG